MKPILFYSIILLFIVSCQKEINIPDTGRKIVINGLINTNDTLAVHISKSLYIGDSTKLLTTDSLTDATVIIYENNQLSDTLTYQKNKTYGLNTDRLVNYKGNYLVPKSGKEYKLMIKYAGYPDVYSTTRIPNIVKIEKVDTSVVTLSGTFEEWQCNISLICDIQFTDTENEENYYLFNVYRSFDDNDAVGIELICNDPVVEEELRKGTMQFGLAFSDKTINGKTYRLRIILEGANIGMPFCDDNYPFPPHKTSIYFRLYSIPKEYFKYIQTLNLFYKNYNNPLAEPTQVYSNIEGGYGIFAGAAISVDSLVFKY